ncbi:hypothetical protein [Streptococcus oricebi]|uniref:Uncharacterized protein n=1 Tax=Streptococcus oricebi TaxID=1547447 RepID=A0ABS5B2B0_9STRE|nr:hypothetical protein [Streptococcus oricebi]MBP2622942.1 hypothetical protein [Streptococcus oricebi]
MEILAMKKFLKMLIDKTNDFLNDKKTDPLLENSNRVQEMIDLALRKKSGIHVIFLDRSFTGDILKYDQDRQQLIVKNFRKSMSIIIRIADIKRISLVPNTIKRAQQTSVSLKDKSKNPPS